MEPLRLTDELRDKLLNPRGLAVTVPRRRSLVIELTSVGLPPIVIHYTGLDISGAAGLVVNAPRQLRVVRGELHLSRKGSSHDTARLPRRQPGTQRAGDLE